MIYYFNYFAVPEHSSAGSLHTNPVPEQCCLAGQSNAKQMLASWSTGRHEDWQPDNMFSRLSTIIRNNLTLILIILNVWAGFGWEQSWTARCSSTFSSRMSICKPSDRKSSSYCCWRATISAILTLLFALFYYYSTIILLLFWLFYRLY